MIQIPSATDHFSVVIQLMREGKYLTRYRRCMKHYEASLKAALLSYETATDELMNLATGAELDSDDEDA